MRSESQYCVHVIIIWCVWPLEFRVCDEWASGETKVRSTKQRKKMKQFNRFLGNGIMYVFHMSLKALFVTHCSNSGAVMFKSPACYRHHSMSKWILVKFYWKFVPFLCISLENENKLADWPAFDIKSIFFPDNLFSMVAIMRSFRSFNLRRITIKHSVICVYIVGWWGSFDFRFH